MRWLILLAVLVTPVVATAQPSAKPQARGNRLAYLDELDPYYPNRHFPKLITPQWVGEEGVEAVVVLAIDDMRDPARYETFLRPILRRLKEIDGRAPVSIMSCSVKPDDPQLQTWLKEGLSLECHTFDHPCPFFKPGFAKAKETYDKCVDLLGEVPNNKPVAFRMPCCDSMNTPSPRFWAEIFNKTTAKKNHLTIDSSVFNVFTSDDPALPKELVLDDKGEERFKPYLPADRSFVNTIENYPYPYVIGKLCWEFPCMTPSDWQAQHRHKPNNPLTLRDWKAALDCTVIKQGVFNVVFHPHGWIKSEQVVEFIDHAVAKHGKKVKFLTFKECQERLNKSLFDGKDYRTLQNTPDSIVHLPPLNGYLGVRMYERGQGSLLVTERTWITDPGVGSWKVKKTEDEAPPKAPEAADAAPKENPFTVHWIPVQDFGKLLVVRKGKETHVFGYATGAENKPTILNLSLPKGARLVDEEGKDYGLRFLDLDGDGKLDVIFSNEKEYGVYLFKDMKDGWSRKVMAGKQGEPGALPPIAKNGTNNGFWVHSGKLWWSNEDTVLLKDHVDRRDIRELLKQAK